MSLAEPRVPRETPIAAVLLAAACVGVAVATAVLAIGLTGLGRAVCIAGAASATALVIAILSEGKLWWLSPPVWFVVPWSLIFVIRPWYDIVHDNVNYQQGLPIAMTYPTAVYVGVLGLFCFIAGFYCLPVRRGHRPEDDKWAHATLSARRTRLLAVVVVLCLGAFVGSNGLNVLLAFFNGRNAVTGTAYATSSGYLYTAPLWLEPIAIFLILDKGPRYRRLRRLGWLILVMSQIFTLGVGDRSFFLQAVLAALLAVQIRSGRPPRVIVVAILLPVVFLAGVVLPRYYRNEQLQQTGSVFAQFGRAATSPVSTELTSDDTSMARDLAVLIAGVPATLPYQDGRTFLSAILRPIPRQLFGGQKPVSGDQLASDQLLKAKTGIEAGFSFSLMGEPYLNAGYLGVAVCLALFGWLCRLLWERLGRLAFESVVRGTLYVCLIAVLPVLVRGGFSVDLQRPLFVTLPLIICLSSVSPKTPLRGGQPSSNPSRAVLAA